MRLKSQWKEDGESDYPLIDLAHWNTNYLPNELMTPSTNSYSHITPFSLEYIDLTHPNYLTDMRVI